MTIKNADPKKVRPKTPWRLRTPAQKKRMWEEWSVTKLGRLEPCGEQFRLEYIDPPDPPVPEPIELIAGRAIHKRLELFFTKPCKSKEDFLKKWRGEWFGSILTYQYPISPDGKDPIRWRMPEGRNGKEPGVHFGRGHHILSRFWDENRYLLPPHPLAPTVEEEVRIETPTGIRLVCIIDRKQPIEHGGFIVDDYKTGMASFPEEKAVRDLQFTVIQYALWHKFGIVPEKMRALLLARQEIVEVPLRNKYHFYNLECLFDEARAKVQNILAPDSPRARELPFRFLNPEDVERGHFVPRPGPYCSSCKFEQLCHFRQPQNADTDAFREHVVSEFLSRHRTEPQSEQLSLNIQFKYKKYRERHRRDMPFEKHKRRVKRGKAKLSMHLD